MAKKKAKPSRTAQPAETPSPAGEIGARLKAARERRKLSQAQLSRETTIARSVLANYEAGRYLPGSKELLKLSSALRISPNEILLGVIDPFGPPALKSNGGEVVDKQTGLLRADVAGATAALAMRIQCIDPMQRRAVYTLVDGLLSAKLSREQLTELDNMTMAVTTALTADSGLLHLVDQAAADPGVQAATKKLSKAKGPR